MSNCIHRVMVTLQFDKKCPPKQAGAILGRLLEGATLEQAIYEESVRLDNNAAPIGYSIAPMSTGLIRKVAETTEVGE